ncbi:hypothetical protein [Actinokineospora enzanensis]|uniref:hypothetical protein n=1 Tax=Actinokineospora enzanensis TaxID=155975 RepID=UPI00037216F5|nr:hypothetical protein [Actinokineospora enzanensis]
MGDLAAGRRISRTVAVLLAVIVLSGGSAPSRGTIATPRAHHIEVLVDTALSPESAEALIGVVDPNAVTLHRFGDDCAGGRRPSLTRALRDAVARVDRVIVLTRRDVDTCPYADRLIGEIRAAGVALDFIGDDLRAPDALDGLAAATGAPDPLRTANPARLAEVLGWLLDVEPAARALSRAVDVLGPAMVRLERTLRVVLDNHLVATGLAREEAGAAVAAVDTSELESRADRPSVAEMAALARTLRERAGRMIDASARVMDTIKSGGPRARPLAVYARAGREYLDTVREIRQVLDALAVKALRPWG